MVAPLTIDRASAVPLYYQIHQHLLRQIEEGGLKPGDLLPSEQEISGSTGVSRMTARQAVKSLCDVGVAYSRRGRGTFVSGIKQEKTSSELLSFTQEMKARGSWGVAGDFFSECKSGWRSCSGTAPDDRREGFAVGPRSPGEWDADGL